MKGPDMHYVNTKPAAKRLLSYLIRRKNCSLFKENSDNIYIMYKKI